MPTYYAYGLSLQSEWPLPYPADQNSSAADLELVDDTAAFSQVSLPRRSDPNALFTHARLDDGSIHLRWSGLFEFLVAADGRRIASRRLGDVHDETFQSYLLGQVLSFALVKRGIEVIHAAAVVVDGQAIAFLGDSGYGKSTLAATFLQAGYPVLTDDLLVLLQQRAGRYCAFPGPARMKLATPFAHALLGAGVAGVWIHPQTQKRIFPLADDQAAHAITPVGAMYALPHPSSQRDDRGVCLTPLSRRDAFLTLLRNTYNDHLLDADRLERHFVLTGALVAALPVTTLSYANELSMLPRVRDAILADLAG